MTHQLPPSELVAWCAGCEWWRPADEIGTECPAFECDRKLRKRRGYVCREPVAGLGECSVVSFSRAEFYEHSCWQV